MDNLGRRRELPLEQTIKLCNRLHCEQKKYLRKAWKFVIVYILALFLCACQVFTTVYDYIPVVGPFFRDKYWLAFLVPGLFAFLPILLRSNKDEYLHEVPRTTRNSWIVTTGGMALVATLGVSMISANPSPPMEEPNSLRVFTYNIQQGYDDLGERNLSLRV